MVLLYVLIIVSLTVNFALIGVLFYFYLKSLKKHKQESLKWKEEKAYYIKKHIHAYDDEHENFTMKGETNND
jgi:uncharacterized ion transporter superfamily protein YfcC